MNMQLEQSKPKTKLWFVMIVIATFNLTMIILNIIIDRKMNDDHAKTGGIIDYITLNLQKKPITDILITTQQNCNQDYEPIDLFTWGGATQGCRDDPRTHGVRLCSSGEFKAIDISKWKQYKLCLKRLIIFTEKLHSSNCSQNMKECAQNLCVPSS